MYSSRVTQAGTDVRQSVESVNSLRCYSALEAVRVPDNSAEDRNRPELTHLPDHPGENNTANQRIRNSPRHLRSLTANQSATFRKVSFGAIQDRTHGRQYSDVALLMVGRPLPFPIHKQCTRTVMVPSRSPHFVNCSGTGSWGFIFDHLYLSMSCS